jgi:site-specific DNA-methyltransferase (adenine-specific)
VAIKQNQKNKVDWFKLLKAVDDESASAVFLDPQYRGILEKMNYGNEGERQKERSALPQMKDSDIEELAFLSCKRLKPSGHLFLWVDKHDLFEKNWSGSECNIKVVDFITWDKERIGMGYRSRRRSEYLIICQKHPQRAKGIWKDHGIPDVWNERIENKEHPHQKPYRLIKRLIECVTEPEDLVVDPCAGSYVVLKACQETGRNFIGGDII